MKAARETRRCFERWEIDCDALKAAYLAYNAHVDDIDEFVQAARRLFPEGCCGLTSTYLGAVTIGAGHVVHGEYDGQPHTWLDVDGTIVDITADQYGGPPVYVGPPQAAWRPPGR